MSRREGEWRSGRGLAASGAEHQDIIEERAKEKKTEGEVEGALLILHLHRGRRVAKGEECMCTCMCKPLFHQCTLFLHPPNTPIGSQHGQWERRLGPDMNLFVWSCSALGPWQFPSEALLNDSYNKTDIVCFSFCVLWPHSESEARKVISAP